MEVHNHIQKIALGGGCHWCTEAVYQSLKGVVLVEQGYVSSTGSNETFSEAVIVHFNTKEISMPVLIEIHLHTHKSTSNHSFRATYRSAVYVFNDTDYKSTTTILWHLQSQFNEALITQVLYFNEFKASREQIQNYYLKNPKKPFCEKYIAPKLQLLLDDFSAFIKK